MDPLINNIQNKQINITSNEKEKNPKLNTKDEALSNIGKQVLGKKPPFEQAKEKENLARMELSSLSDYAELEKEEDIDDDQVKKIQASMLPVSDFPDSPFADTDLVVFKNNFNGILPMNGIKENDLNLINQIYQDILNDESEFEIVNYKLDLIKDDNELEAEFRNKVLLSIKTLLTRAMGRKLIYNLLNFKTEIMIREGGSSRIASKRGNVIQMALRDSNVFSVHPSGKIVGLHLPFFLVLGHELIHVLQTFQQKLENSLQKPPVLGEKYDNLMEQITITGLKKGMLLNEAISAEDYEEINERNLIGAFSGSLTEFYKEKEEIRWPREGHLGFTYSVNLNELEENRLWQFENDHKLKAFDRYTLDEKYKQGELYKIAIHLGRNDILKVLLNINPNPRLSGSLIMEAAKSAHNLEPLQLSAILELLIKAGHNLNVKDEEGNTPLHYLFQAGADCIKKFIAHGAKWEENKAQQDPFDFGCTKLPDPNLFKTDFQETLDSRRQFLYLYNMLKTFCSKEDILHKLQDKWLPYVFVYGDDETVAECLELLHQNKFDFSQEVFDSALISLNPQVISKFKAWNLDLNKIAKNIPWYYGLDNKNRNPSVISKVKKEDLKIDNSTNEIDNSDSEYFSALDNSDNDNSNSNSVFDTEHVEINNLDREIENYNSSYASGSDSDSDGSLNLYSSLISFIHEFLNSKQKNTEIYFLQNQVEGEYFIKRIYEFVKAMDSSLSSIDQTFLSLLAQHGKEEDILEAVEIVHQQKYDFKDHFLSEAILSFKPNVINKLKEFGLNLSNYNIDSKSIKQFLGYKLNELNNLNNYLFINRERDIKQWFTNIHDLLAAINSDMNSYKDLLVAECMQLKLTSLALHVQTLFNIDINDMLSEYFTNSNEFLEIDQLLELNRDSIDWKRVDDQGNSYLHRFIDCLNNVLNQTSIHPFKLRYHRNNIRNAIKKCVYLQPSLVHQKNKQAQLAIDLASDPEIKNFLSNLQK